MVPVQRLSTLEVCIVAEERVASARDEAATVASMARRVLSVG